MAVMQKPRQAFILDSKKANDFLALSHLRSIIKSLRREHSRCEKFLKMKLRRSKKFAKEELFSLKRLMVKLISIVKILIVATII